MTQNNHKRSILLVAGLLGLVALAGCTESDTPDNQPPEAVLETDRDTAMVGEPFTFDAQSSRDPDGEIQSWRFDFGDGTEMRVDDEDAARVEHAYDEGGEYLVKVFVTDDGAEEEAAQTDSAETRIAVNEEFVIAPGAVYAAPLPNQTASQEVPFQANEGVDAYELDLEVESVLVTGSSEIRITIVDAGGDTVFDETVVVGAGETIDLETSGSYTSIGDAKVIVEADSGGANVTGDLLMVYDDGF